jgi:hypothetical protein
VEIENKPVPEGKVELESCFKPSLLEHKGRLFIIYWKFPSLPSES